MLLPWKRRKTKQSLLNVNINTAVEQKCTCANKVQIKCTCANKVQIKCTCALTDITRVIKTFYLLTLLKQKWASIKIESIRSCTQIKIDRNLTNCHQKLPSFLVHDIALNIFQEKPCTSMNFRKFYHNPS